MLDTPEQIAAFIDYQSAGGLQKPVTFGLAFEAKNLSHDLCLALSTCVDESNDYAAVGVEPLVLEIDSLYSELSQATLVSDAMVSYLDIAATPSDLEIVAVGVRILDKIHGESPKPAPSIEPIINREPIDALLGAVQEMNAHKINIVDVMSKINAAMIPVTPPEKNAGGGGLVPPLPPALIDEALALSETLSGFKGIIAGFATALKKSIDEAVTERDKAKLAFNDCVSFTMLNNQKNNPAINQAADSIYPK